MWKRAAGVRLLLGVLGVMMIFGTNVLAESLYWTNPTTYTDNTLISVQDQALITTTTYWGNTSSGPWNVITTTAAGATSAPVTVGAPGTTRYFTAEANLHGMTSAKAPAYGYMTPFPVPAAPGGLRVW